jgi:hypothetical protein
MGLRPLKRPKKKKRKEERKEERKEKGLFKKTDVTVTRRNRTHPKNNRNDGARKDCGWKNDTKRR